MCKYCDVRTITEFEEDGVTRFEGKYDIPEQLGADLFSVKVNMNYYHEDDSFLGYLTVDFPEDELWGIYDIKYCPMCGRKLTFNGGSDER